MSVTSARERNSLLTAAITDARRQLARCQEQGSNAAAAIAVWRHQNPGLVALVDHSEGVRQERTETVIETPLPAEPSKEN